MSRYLPLFMSPGSAAYFPLTLMRVAIGLFFFASGFNKVFVPASQAMMLETITEAGIPFPAIAAVFVASCEMLCGLLLAGGILSRLNAAVLTLISVVALFTVGIHHIPGGISLLTWYSWLLYLPETLYMLILVMVIVQGSGPWSVDRLIAKGIARR